MEIVQGIQSNHSENIYVIAEFKNTELAKKAFRKLKKFVGDELERHEKFHCASQSQSFKKKEEAESFVKSLSTDFDDRCSFEIARRRELFGDGCENPDNWQVSIDYGKILADWCDQDVWLEQVGKGVGLAVYTAGYGIEAIEEILMKNQGDVGIYSSDLGMDFNFKEWISECKKEEEKEEKKRRKKRKKQISKFKVISQLKKKDGEQDG